MLRVCLLRRYQGASAPSDEDLLIDEAIASMDVPSDGPGRFMAGVLLAYARRTATRALRGRDSGFLSLGLKALTVGGRAADYRDLLPIVAVIYDSGRRIGVDVIALFQAVGADAGSNVQQALRVFIALGGKAVELRTYQAGLVGTGDGETYV
jgi:hypothetical protein